MDDRHEADRGTVIYFYLKPYSDPENHTLHMFGCTPVFEEMLQTFSSLSLMAQMNPAFDEALEKMTIHFD